MDPLDILLVSTADWDNPYWTNKQHTAVDLARRGHRVLFVESQGLRAPGLGARDLRRVWRRLRRGLAPPRQVREGLWVWSPLTLPFQGLGWVRRMNRLALRLGLTLARRRAGLRPTVMWTFSPLTPALYDLAGYRVLYHAVDDVSAQPGMPAATLRTAEAELARRADLVFATAPALKARLEADGAREAVLLPNVCDVEHFARAMHPDIQAPKDMAAIAPPRIGFVGAVSGYKLDLGLLEAVARARPTLNFVLIGEVGEGDPDTDVSRLHALPNLHLIGGRAYRELPAYLSGVDVAILPAAANAYTAAMFPMKFFEYLAAGLPVVCTPLSALEPYAPAAIVAEGPRAFAEGIDRALAGRGPPLAVRLAACAGRTYGWRTGLMLDRLASLDRAP